MENGVVSRIDLRSNLCRLARFGANISDAHSCFIFLPLALFETDPWQQNDDDCLILGGYQSLSTEVIETPRIEKRSGLIGWVAEHRQSIHVSPFEHDSRTLGIYRSDQKLKSFIGIPVPGLPATKKNAPNTGVIACDSKKSFAFSKLQGKLLEDLANEVANSVNLAYLHLREQNSGPTWEKFAHKGSSLVEAIGRNSVEVIRLAVTNFQNLEESFGTQVAIALLEQLYRLIQQALPPHFPNYLLPNGDFVLVIDNMMSAFYENKIRAIAQHLSRNHGELELLFVKRSFADRQYRGAALEDLIRSTCRTSETMRGAAEGGYEHHRA